MLTSGRKIVSAASSIKVGVEIPQREHFLSIMPAPNDFQDTFFITKFIFFWVVLLMAVSRLCLFLLLYKESNAFTTYFLQKLFMVFSANSFSFIQEVCYPIQWIFCGRPFLVFLYFHPYLKGLLAHEIILDLLYYLHPLFEGNICSIQGSLAIGHP